MITINVTELFTPEQLDALRKEYNPLEGLYKEEYDKISAMLKLMTLPQLDQLSKAGIKYITPMAFNRVIMRTNE